MHAQRLFQMCLLTSVGAGIAISCSLDKRKLQTPNYAAWLIMGGAGEGGAPGGADYNPNDDGGDPGTEEGGARNHAGSTSSGGADTPEPALVDGCPDLDANGVGDCTETLVKNPNFAENVADWSAGDDSFIEWSAQNHFDDLPSGSALVSVRGYTDADGMMQRASSQCVTFETASKLRIFANVFYKSDQGEGGPGLGLFFFGSSDCSGASLGFPLSVEATSADSWQTLTAERDVPEGSHSALVRLAVTKPLRSMVFKASFDNILTRTEP
jgi:hypothetical protein